MSTTPASRIRAAITCQPQYLGDVEVLARARTGADSIGCVDEELDAARLERLGFHAQVVSRPASVSTVSPVTFSLARDVTSTLTCPAACGSP
jgi:hypothetical protein